MTLGELLKGKTLPVKVKYKSTIFEIFSISIFENAVGCTLDDRFPVFIPLDQEGCTLYQEQKKKIIRYLWASSSGQVTASLYSVNEIDPGIFNIRLDWSATEFEET